MMRFLLALFLVFASVFAKAQAPAPAPATMEKALVKNRVETMITQQLFQALQTTLEKNSYEVYVEAEVEKRPSAALTESSVSPLLKEPIPTDMTLGVIDAEPLIRMYADKIARLEKEKAPDPTLENYEIKSITINLGLNANYPENYKKDMDAWLRKWVRFNLDQNAKINVDYIKSPPPKKESPEAGGPDAENKKDEGILDKASKMQLLIGLLALAITLLVIALVASFISSQNSKRNAAALIEAQKAAAKLAPAREIPELEEKAEEPEMDEDLSMSDESVNTIHQLKEFKEITQKIYMIYKFSPHEVEQLSFMWLEAGEEGLKKFALFLDTKMDFLQRNPEEAPPVTLVPEHKQAALSDVFVEMAKQKLPEKLQILKTLYWDLLAVKSFGLAALKKPFSYLTSLGAEEILQLTSSQSMDVQAVMVLNMPDDAREAYLKKLDTGNKKDIIKTSLKLKEVEHKEIETISETLKNLSGGQKLGKKVVPTLPLSIKLIKGLNALEEVEILRSVVLDLSDKGEALRLGYASLAFLESWNEDSVQIFFDGISPELIINFLSVMPGAQTKVIEALPPRMKQIVEDDLKMQRPVGREELEKSFFSLRNHLNSLLASGSLNLDTLYEKSKGVGSYAA